MSRPAGDDRLSKLDRWLDEPGTDDLMRLYCRQAAAQWPLVVSVLTRLVLTSTRSDGCTDQSLEQLAAKTRQSTDQVRRALAALTKAGVVVTEQKAVSGGRGGGKGRAAVRRVTILWPAAEPAAAEPATTIPATEMGARRSRNDRASGRAPLRVLSTETPPVRSVDNLKPAAAEPAGRDDENKLSPAPRSEPVAQQAKVVQVARRAAERYAINEHKAGRCRTVQGLARAKQAMLEQALVELVNRTGTSWADWVQYGTVDDVAQAVLARTIDGTSPSLGLAMVLDQAVSRAQALEQTG
jgi:hypothetical protein